MKAEILADRDGVGSASQMGRVSSFSPRRRGMDTRIDIQMSKPKWQACARSPLVVNFRYWPPLRRAVMFAALLLSAERGLANTIGLAPLGFIKIDW